MMHSLTIPFPFFPPTRLFFYGLKPTPQIPSIIKHQDQQCRSPKHFLPSHSSLAPALRCSTPRAKPATRKSHHHFPHARCGYFFCLCLFFTKTIIRKLFTYSLRLFFHRDLFLPPKKLKGTSSRASRPSTPSHTPLRRRSRTASTFSSRTSRSSMSATRWRRVRRPTASRNSRTSPPRSSRLRTSTTTRSAPRS